MSQTQAQGTQGLGLSTSGSGFAMAQETTGAVNAENSGPTMDSDSGDRRCLRDS